MTTTTHDDYRPTRVEELRGRLGVRVGDLGEALRMLGDRIAGDTPQTDEDLIRLGERAAARREAASTLTALRIGREIGRQDALR